VADGNNRYWSLSSIGRVGKPIFLAILGPFDRRGCPAPALRAKNSPKICKKALRTQWDDATMPAFARPIERMTWPQPKTSTARCAYEKITQSETS
jgi:hypothetical protein